jgi:hypothetical protein
MGNMLTGGFLTYVSDTVTITRPMASSYVRGVVSPNVRAPTFSIRMHEDVVENVDAAAHALGMTRGDFIRWCSKQIALDILRQKREYDAAIKADVP